MAIDEKAQASQEPSMEDILASIRRILSEETAEKSGGNQESEPSPPENDSQPEVEEPEPLAMHEEPDWPEEPDPVAIEPDDDDPADSDAELELADVDETPYSRPQAADVLELTSDMRVGPVVSRPTAAASTDVLQQLAKAILDRRDISIGTQGVTLEGMVREMLRPLLREWLDRNLPYLIERLVKREIDVMVNRAERLED